MLQWGYVEEMLQWREAWCVGEKPNPLNAPPASPSVTSVTAATSSEPRETTEGGRGSRGWRSTVQKATQPLEQSCLQTHSVTVVLLLHSEDTYLKKPEGCNRFFWRRDFNNDFACWVEWTCWRVSSFIISKYAREIIEALIPNLVVILPWDKNDEKKNSNKLVFCWFMLLNYTIVLLIINIQ